MDHVLAVGLHTSILMSVKGASFLFRPLCFSSFLIRKIHSLNSPEVGVHVILWIGLFAVVDDEASCNDDAWMSVTLLWMFSAVMM